MIIEKMNKSNNIGKTMVNTLISSKAQCGGEDHFPLYRHVILSIP